MSVEEVILLKDSILESVRMAQGIDPTCTDFDSDIIIHINTGLFNLTQMGVGPDSGYSVIDDTQTWAEFLQGRTDLEAAKSYVILHTKLLFDPPQSSFVTESMKNMLQEMSWRLSVAASKVT